MMFTQPSFEASTNSDISAFNTSNTKYHPVAATKGGGTLRGEGRHFVFSVLKLHEAACECELSKLLQPIAQHILYLLRYWLQEF